MDAALVVVASAALLALLLVLLALAARRTAAAAASHGAATASSSRTQKPKKKKHVHHAAGLRLRTAKHQQQQQQSHHPQRHHQHQPHHLQVQAFKGHREDVVSCDFLGDSHVVTASEDRSIRVWRLGAGSTFAKAVVARDAPARVCATANSGGLQLVYVLLRDSDDVQVYEVSDEGGEGGVPSLALRCQFATKHGGEVCGMALAPDQSFLVTCSGGSDTSLNLWNTRTGESLHSVATKRLRNNGVVVAPCSRLVFVWTQFGAPLAWNIAAGSRSGHASPHIAMELNAKHAKTKTKVVAIAVSASGALACVHEDGSVQMWRVDVRYEDGEDARAMHAFSLPVKPTNTKMMPVALTSDGGTLVYGAGGALVVCRARDTAEHQSGSVVVCIDDAHDGADVRCVRLDAAQRRVLTCADGDRSARLWNLPPL